jgi:LemA protein
VRRGAKPIPMKRSTILLLVVLGLIVIWAISFQRSTVGASEGVAAQWSNVENAYQLRADKTKNLVEIIKGSADFENKTLREVVEARAQATSVKIDKFQQAQANYGGALSRLLVTVEQYPTLQTTAAFRDFQAQYEGMENRIGVERNRYNDVARDFNTRIKRFPGNLLAGLFGFTEKGYFKAQEGTENAPDISFK